MSSYPELPVSLTRITVEIGMLQPKNVPEPNASIARGYRGTRWQNDRDRDRL